MLEPEVLTAWFFRIIIVSIVVLYVFFSAYLYFRVKILARSIRTDHSALLLTVTFLHFVGILALGVFAILVVFSAT